MKTTIKKFYAFTLSLLVLAAGSLVAQSNGNIEKAIDSGSLEDLKQAFSILGQDLKLTASETRDFLAQWLSEKGANLGEKANAATIQTKVGVVLETNKDNLTIVLLGTDGKNTTFAVTGDTQIMTQDTVTALQTPFTGGKIVKFKNIKKGDWVNLSFNLKDWVQARLPNATSGPIQVQAIDILR